MPKNDKANKKTKSLFQKDLLKLKTEILIGKLIEGEQSGFVTNFNRDEYLKNLHLKYLNRL